VQKREVASGEWPFEGSQGKRVARKKRGKQIPRVARDDKVVVGEGWSFVPVGDGLGDDADVGDAGNAKGIDDSAEGAERDGFVGAEIDDIILALRLFFDFIGELMNVDFVVAEIDELIFVDGDDEFLFSDFLDGVGFGNVDLDAGLENGGGDHKDDEENENDIDEGDHVDVGERGLRGFGKLGHGSLLRDVRGAVGDRCAATGDEEKSDE
jgi:hypothetical protein